MNVAHKNQVVRHQNSPICIAFEYPLKDTDINGAVIQLSGRYPAQGRATNTQCKELAYVIEGSGKIVVDGKEVTLAQGDVILIKPGEKFYWDGIMTLFISCTPAWTPEQHKYVD